MRRIIPYLVLVLSFAILSLHGCGDGEKAEQEDPASFLPEYLPRSMDFHIFYYAWYGTPEFDGEYRYWNHAVLSEDGSKTDISYGAGDDIASNFYPRNGCYSSNDPETLTRHCFEIRLAGAGVICISWWGEGSFSDRAVPRILETAASHGLKVNFHIEPFEGRTADSVRESIVYIIDEYSDHPAFYRTDRFGERPLFYIFETFAIDTDSWRELLVPEGRRTIRGTEHDAIVIALIKEHEHLDQVIGCGFDGCYTYYVSDGYTWAADTRNWEDIAGWAVENNMLFVPCIGPGYNDTRIRPWNGDNVRDRNRGEYFKAMLSVTMRVQPPFVGVSSFNQWHEGTQIESAVPKSTDKFTYLDYSPWPHDYYLHRTRSLLGNFKYTFSQ
jgi:glycoprotein endo-alpha-1,2-mannosidase